MENIRLQDTTGPTEAARAIRKKLKYGSNERQKRALDILDSLLSNGGSHFQRICSSDEALLERLRILPTDDMVDMDVKNKCQLLYRQWAVAYKSVQGMHSIATLYNSLPKKGRQRREDRSEVLRQTAREAQEDPFGVNDDPTPPPAQGAPPQGRRKSSVSSPAAASASAHARQPSSSSTGFFGSSRKEKKSKARGFNLEKEKPQIESAIAQATIASTGLLNNLKLINRDSGGLPSADRDTVTKFERCKHLRRQILRYIHHIERHELLGSLINANDELVKALLAYELLEKGEEDDSDSDAEDVKAAIATGDPHASRPRGNSQAVSSQLAGLDLSSTGDIPPAKPPRPQASAPPPAAQAPPVPKTHDVLDDDEVDPFGDENEI